MGSSSSSIDQLKIHLENNRSSKTFKSEDDAITNSNQSSRSSKEGTGGKMNGNNNLTSNRKDKDYISAMSRQDGNYIANKEEKSIDALKESDERPLSKMDGVVIKTISHDDDIIEQIAAENFTDPHKIMYELDTIGYYIANDDAKNKTQSTVDNTEEKNRIKALIERSLAKDQDQSQIEKKESNESIKQKTEQRFEMFKKIYGSNRPKSKGRSRVANKHTLILVRVGSQFKYIAVPAYLPGQKLYKSKTFARPYIERAMNLKKMERSKADEASDSSEVKEESSKSEKVEGKRSSESKTTKFPSVSATNRPTFYVGNGNGTSIVEGVLTSLGWKRITDRHDIRFKLKWVQCKTAINYSCFKEGFQLVNHIPNSHLLTNKLGLLNSLRSYERVTFKTKGRLPRLKMNEFHPETYILDEHQDREEFLRTYKDNEIWICKPTGLNQGKGIFLIRSRKEIEAMLEERDQKKTTVQFMKRIVQRYIPNPLLLEGRKFDIRAYMLVASTVPFLILFHQGYVRLCCHEYEADNMDLGRHLTNQYVQKKDPNYEELKESTAWSMDKFNEYINENVRPDCPIEIEEDWVHNTFTKQMQKIMIHLFNSVKHRLESRIGFFDLFGLDFMVDTNMKIYLIEVNTNPALACNCEALLEVIPGVIKETLNVSIECFEKSKRIQPLLPLKSLRNFKVLYCGSQRYADKPQPSKSATRVKESNSQEKPKLAVQSSEKVPTLPTLFGIKRQLTQNMTRSTADKRQHSEKQDSAAKKNLNSQSKSSSSSKNDNSDDVNNAENNNDVKNDVKTKESEQKHVENEFSRVNSDKKLSSSEEAHLKMSPAGTLDGPRKLSSRGKVERGN